MMKTVISTALTFTVACWALLAVTAAAPVPDGLTMPATVAAEVSGLEAEAASHPCSTGLGGTCKDEEGSTCYIFNPHFPGPPVRQEGACNSESNGCGEEEEE